MSAKDKQTDNPIWGVHELAFWDGGWHYLNILLDAGAGENPPGSVSALASTTYKGEPRVYYIGRDIGTGNHIKELAFWGGRWHYLDVTLAAGAGGQPAAAGSALTSTTSVIRAAVTPGAGWAGWIDGGPCVYYVGTDNHVKKLAFQDGEWRYVDVQLAAGAGIQPLLPAPGSPLTSMTYNHDTRHVYYIGNDDYVKELAFGNGNYTIPFSNKWEPLLMSHYS